MNTDKLLKAIQILIKEELKETLPKLIKESVKMEVKRILAENKVSQPKKAESSLSMAKAILGNEDTIIENVEKKVYTKNGMINDILNETRMQYAGSPYEVSESTMVFDSSNVPMSTGIAPDLRAQMAAKMGYSDMGGKRTGLGVQTGVAELDKAFNRDYSELVKRFKK
jgi:hypothetical protein